MAFREPDSGRGRHRQTTSELIPALHQQLQLHTIVKPVDYEKFAEAIKSLGLYISLVEVPEANGAK